MIYGLPPGKVSLLPFRLQGQGPPPAAHRDLSLGEVGERAAGGFHQAHGRWVWSNRQKES